MPIHADIYPLTLSKSRNQFLSSALLVNALKVIRIPLVSCCRIPLFALFTLCSSRQYFISIGRVYPSPFTSRAIYFLYESRTSSRTSNVLVCVLVSINWFRKLELALVCLVAAHSSTSAWYCRLPAVILLWSRISHQSANFTDCKRIYVKRILTGTFRKCLGRGFRG